MKKNILNVINKAQKMFVSRNIILASLSTISTVAPIFGCAWSSNLTNSTYIFNGQNYSSFDEIVNEVKQNSRKRITNSEKNSVWSVVVNGVEQTFDDPYVLRQTIEEQYISEVDIKTDIALENFANENGILNSGDKNIWNHIFSSDFKESQVYMGKDGLNYPTADEAFMSFFQIKSGYSFNGIYFESQYDLKNYLLKVYLPGGLNKQQENTIVLKAPSGATSAPIDLSQNGAIESIKSFIINNSEQTFQYTNPVTNERFGINNYNIDQVIDKVYLNDLDGYLHIQSNDGESRYVIDNRYDDGNNLIGPYFYDGVLDIGSFGNKNMWRKVIGVKKQVYAESKIDSIISTFFTTIINDDPVLNKNIAESTGTDPLLFRTLLETPEKSSYDEWFLRELGVLSPALKSSVIKANLDLMEGKKYNVFDKIPILYNFLMNRVVSWGLGIEVQNLIVEYFSKVCDFVQDAIDVISLYNPIFLRSKDGRSTFNVKEFFQIGNPEYDLNTNIEYFRNEIKTRYPNLLALMSTYISAMNNITLAGGLIPFERVDHSYLFEFGIFDINTVDFNKVGPSLKEVYELFSKLSYDEMIPLYIKYSKREDVRALASVPEAEQKSALEALKTTWTASSLGTFLSSIGAKNNQYYQMANSLLKTEIQTFLETGHIVVGGYLAKLYSNNDSQNKLPLFLQYVSNNNIEDVYQVYILFMLDKRLSMGVINQEAISSPIAFAHAVSRIVLLGFGSSYLVGTSIKSLYAQKSYKPSAYKDDDTGIPSPTDNPVLTLFKKDDGSNVAVDGSAGNDTHLRQSFSNENEQFGSTNDNLGTQKSSKAISHDDSISERGMSTKGELVFTPKDNPGKTFLPRVKTVYQGEQYSKIKGLNPNLNLQHPNAQLYDNWRLLMSDLHNKLAIPQPDNNPTQLFDEMGRLDDVERNDQRRLSTISHPSDAASVESSKRFDYTVDLGRQWGIFSTSGKPYPGEATFEESKKTWWTRTTNAFDKVKNAVFTIADYALEIFATAATVMELFFFFYELFSVKYTQEFYVYVTADGTEFIWDGGISATKFLGLVNENIQDIGAMKLLNPVQITLPQLEEAYFYNGIKYYDAREMKKQILRGMINGSGPYNKEKFVLMYSFMKNINENYSTSFTIDELVNEVIKDIGIVVSEDNTIDYSNLNRDSIYLSSTNLSVGSGVIIDSGDNYGTITRNIVDNTRKAFFVVLPDVDATNTATGTISRTFSFPGDYWDGSKVVTQDKSKFSYIIEDNSANDLKGSVRPSYLQKTDFVTENPGEAESLSIQRLFETFKTKFNLKTKNSLTSGKLTPYFADVGNVTTRKIFLVKLPDGQHIYFENRKDASNYLYGYFQLSKSSNYELRVEYYYDGLSFSSSKELEEWIRINTEIVK